MKAGFLRIVASSNMTRLACACTAAILVHVVALPRAQSVYPTGTTIYDPDRAWNGYTVLSPLATQAVVVIDMNGNVVKQWEGYNNSAGGPARVLPGGFVVAASGARPPHQESLELLERDFAGNIVWQFSHNQQITTRDGSTVWSARQHHDWQRENFPAGYYSPDNTPAVEGGTTLILTHTDQTQPNVADAPLTPTLRLPLVVQEVREQRPYLRGEVGRAAFHLRPRGAENRRTSP